MFVHRSFPAKCPIKNVIKRNQSITETVNPNPHCFLVQDSSMTLFSIYKAAERQTPSLLFLHLDYTLSKRKGFFSFKLIIRLDQVTMNTPLAMQQQGLAAWGIP